MLDCKRNAVSCVTPELGESERFDLLRDVRTLTFCDFNYSLISKNYSSIKVKACISSVGNSEGNCIRPGRLICIYMIS